MFAGSEYIRKGTVIEMYKQIVDRENLKGLILVVQSQMTSFAKKYLESWPFNVEIFRVSFLMSYFFFPFRYSFILLKFLIY